MELSDRKVLIVTGEVEREIYLSARNLPKVSVQEVGSVNTLELIDAEVLILQESALEALTETLSTAEASGAEPAAA
jgi:large subunit ribosomal protein L4